MASCKFKEFKPNIKGYAGVMNGSGCQQMLTRMATNVKEQADALTDNTRHTKGYTSIPDYESVEWQGKLACGRVIRTKSNRARYAQALDKTLTKALNSAR